MSILQKSKIDFHNLNDNQFWMLVCPFLYIVASSYDRITGEISFQFFAALLTLTIMIGCGFTLRRNINSPVCNGLPPSNPPDEWGKKKENESESKEKLLECNDDEGEEMKPLEEYVQQDLPELFMAEKAKYSNTIELYDAIPKYVWAKRIERIEGRFLNSLERSFRFRNSEYRVMITPARIKDKDGVDRDYFPGRLEELIEDALRKLAADRQGVYLDEYASVVFSLNELQAELKKMGHSYSKDQIKEALDICAGTGIILMSQDGSAIVKSHLFETLGIQGLNEYREFPAQGRNKTARCFVRFNTLVTKSIKEKTFRPINYETSMAYKSNIARWLHKRMSHLYTQAAWNYPYHINLSTIIRDSGINRYPKIKDNLREIRQALDEIKERNVILRCDENLILEGRKIFDVKFIIIPHPNFTQEVKEVNSRLKSKNNMLN